MLSLHNYTFNTLLIFDGTFIALLIVILAFYYIRKSYVNKRDFLIYSEIFDKVILSLKIDKEISDLLNDEDECSVCLEDFEENCKIRVLLCKHVFHEKCIMSWIFKKQQCPVCRTDMSIFFLE